MNEEKSYRLLNIGEIIKEGDELCVCLAHGKAWESVGAADFGRQHCYFTEFIRRPIPHPADAPEQVIEGWVAIGSKDVGGLLSSYCTTNLQSSRDSAIKVFTKMTEEQPIACIKVSFKKGDGL